MQMVPYRLFLDDERWPSLSQLPGDGWAIVRSVAEAQRIIAEFGMPVFVSFDHDLGDGAPTGMDFARWLVDQDLDGNPLPPNFSFYVHSQNPVGAENIRSYLGKYLAQRAAPVNWKPRELPEDELPPWVMDDRGPGSGGPSLG